MERPGRRRRGPCASPSFSPRRATDRSLPTQPSGAPKGGGPSGVERERESGAQAHAHPAHPRLSCPPSLFFYFFGNSRRPCRPRWTGPSRIRRPARPGRSRRPRGSGGAPWLFFRGWGAVGGEEGRGLCAGWEGEESGGGEVEQGGGGGGRLAGGCAFALATAAATLLRKPRAPEYPRHGGDRWVTRHGEGRRVQRAGPGRPGALPQRGANGPSHVLPISIGARRGGRRGAAGSSHARRSLLSHPAAQHDMARTCNMHWSGRGRGCKGRQGRARPRARLVGVVGGGGGRRVRARAVLRAPASRAGADGQARRPTGGPTRQRVDDFSGQLPAGMVGARTGRICVRRRPKWMVRWPGWLALPFFFTSSRSPHKLPSGPPPPRPPRTHSLGTVCVGGRAVWIANQACVPGVAGGRPKVARPADFS